MSGSRFQFGPLHLCDYLIRSDVGVSNITLEIAPGYSDPGCQMRDLFEFSRLLDLYALLNVPLHVLIVAPSSTADDPAADPFVQVEAWQWPHAPHRGTPGRLGRAMDLPGRRQTVRSVRQVASGERRLAPRLSQRRPASRRFVPQAGLRRLQSLRQELIA